jgi:uncharacterized protein YcbX
MDWDSRFVVNAPHVIHDTIDGVSVIINLASGRYYSLQNTATDIWGLVGVGSSAQDIVEVMRDRYDGADVDMRQIVQGFLEQLLQEGLVRVHDADEAPERPVPDALLAELTAIPQAPFAVPVLEIYRDLEDLLLLDPIHEVGEEGWPVAKPAGSDTD